MDFESPAARPIRKPRLAVHGAREAVRSSAVRMARARIAAGYYDREDVREKLLDAVLEEIDRS